MSLQVLQSLPVLAVEQKLNIKQYFSTPIYIFLDLESKLDEVSFTGYQIGSNSSMFWGIVYEGDRINILGSCKYNLSELSRVLDIWKRNGLTYAFITGDNKVRTYKLSQEKIDHKHLSLELLEQLDDKRRLRNIHPIYEESFKRRCLSDPEYPRKVEVEGFTLNKFWGENYGELADLILYSQYRKYKALLGYNEGKVSLREFHALYPGIEDPDKELRIVLHYLSPDKNPELTLEYLRLLIKTLDAAGLSITTYNLGPYVDNRIGILCKRIVNAFEEGELKWVLNPQDECYSIEQCMRSEHPTCEVYQFPRGGREEDMLL